MPRAGIVVGFAQITLLKSHPNRVPPASISGVAVRYGVKPNLVATGSLTVELKAECFQLANYVFVTEPGKPSHAHAATMIV